MLAALINAVVLIAITVLIAREAVVRFLHPAAVQQGLMLAVAREQAARLATGYRPST